LFREQLEEQIIKLYAEISFKPHVPCLSDKYELSLVEAMEGQDSIVGASTGEN
jgi:DNA sulfur modification protein DndD